MVMKVCVMAVNMTGRFSATLPLDETVSPLAPHSSTTAPGAGGPVGPFSPPLEHLLLQGKQTEQKKKTDQTDFRREKWEINKVKMRL